MKQIAILSRNTFRRNSMNLSCLVACVLLLLVVPIRAEDHIDPELPGTIKLPIFSTIKKLENQTHTFFVAGEQEKHEKFADLYAHIRSGKPLSVVLEPAFTERQRTADCTTISSQNFYYQIERGGHIFKSFICRLISYSNEGGVNYTQFWKFSHHSGREQVCIRSVRSDNGTIQRDECSKRVIKWRFSDKLISLQEQLELGILGRLQNIEKALSLLPTTYDFVTSADRGILRRLEKIVIAKRHYSNWVKHLHFFDTTCDGYDLPTLSESDEKDAQIINCFSKLYSSIREGKKISVLTDTGRNEYVRRQCDKVEILKDDGIIMSFECHILIRDRDRDDPHIEPWVYSHLGYDDNLKSVDQVAMKVIDMKTDRSIVDKKLTGHRKVVWLVE